MNKKAYKVPFTSTPAFWLIFSAVQLILVFWIFLKLKSALNLTAAFLWLTLNAIFVAAWLFFKIYFPKKRIKPNRKDEQIFGCWTTFVLFSFAVIAIFGISSALLLIATLSAVLCVSAVFFLCLARHKDHYRVVMYEIETEKLPPETEKLRIVHVSDLHLGHWTGSETAENIIAQINTQIPDIIVMTGDIIDEKLGNDCGEELTAMHRLSVKYGIFATIGNHDYANLENVTKFMKQSNIILLDTQSVEIAGIIIVGANDRDHLIKERWGLSRSELLTLAYEFVQKKHFLLMLRHRPFVEDGTRGHFDLQLSGHSHGTSLSSTLLRKFALKRKKKPRVIPEGGTVITTDGIGYIGAPARIYSSPEISVIDLVKKQ